MRKAFVFIAAALTIVFGAAGAPTPLYSIYQQQWHFSTITLTIIFAVYAFALLTALLIGGSLSDYIGRRPVLLAAAGLLVISMIVFATASGVPSLIFARVLQGIATGIAVSTMSAFLLDTEPKDRPGLGARASSSPPIIGIGLGALVAGFLAQYVAWPTHVIYVIFGALFALIFVGILMMSDSSARKPGWQQSLVPSVTVPPKARPYFLIASPSLAAIWALSGFYLSLSPSLTIELLKRQNYVVSGLLIVVFFFAAGWSSTYFRARKDSQLLTMGSILASIGITITAVSIYIPSVALLFVGTLIAGSGFGTTFSGAFRSIISRASADNRAGLSSAVYIVSYLSFSVPAIIAGIAATKISLNSTVLIYCIVLITLFAGSLVLSRVRKPPT